MTEPLYLNDTHKIRNLNETDFEYSFQFWIDNGTQHELTGEWSDWEFLKLYDTRDEVETMIDDKNSSWFIIYQINDKFALIDLRKGKKMTKTYTREQLIQKMNNGDIPERYFLFAGKDIFLKKFPLLFTKNLII